MHTEDFFFTANEQRLAGTRITPDGRTDAAVLALHGLGATSTRGRIRYLLDDLAAAGHGSVTFEFSGNGDSTGMLTESTLRGRRLETLAAAEWLVGEAPRVLLGTSMGAHLAATTVPELRPRGLVLFCPAAYPAGAADLRFDGSLSAPNNYPDSPAYAGIREFDGDLLIVATRGDQVIPPAVIDGYLDNARNAKSTEVIWIDDCDHLVHRWLPDQPAPRAEITQAVLRLLNTSTSIPREMTSRAG
ncbi:MAG TPA: alpha/beta fold hydrolase [Pseudonocardiaceae bacterium]